jgi:hypothetical protein
MAWSVDRVPTLGARDASIPVHRHNLVPRPLCRGPKLALLIVRRLPVRTDPEMPVVGFLSSFTTNPRFAAAFRQGLGEAGYVEGRNVAIEYRWAEGRQYDRLPTLRCLGPP